MYHAPNEGDGTVKNAVNVLWLPLEAGVLAVAVAGIAGLQDPDRGTWVEHNPLLFGGYVAVIVLALCLLLTIASNSDRR
jgi:hypothetical protein